MTKSNPNVKIFQPVQGATDYVCANDHTTLDKLIERLEEIRDRKNVWGSGVFYVKKKVEIEIEQLIPLPEEEEELQYQMIRFGREQAPGLVYKIHDHLNDELMNRAAWRKTTGQSE